MYPGTPDLARREVTEDDDRSVLRDLLESWSREHETVFDVRVQLRTDAATIPVEDATVDRPQERSPSAP